MLVRSECQIQVSRRGLQELFAVTFRSMSWSIPACYRLRPPLHPMALLGVLITKNNRLLPTLGVLSAYS